MISFDKDVPLEDSLLTQYGQFPGVLPSRHAEMKMPKFLMLVGKLASVSMEGCKNAAE